MTKQRAIIVVAGPDEEQRPHAARFGQPDESQATKAAALMGFKIGLAQTPKALSLARGLPKGRVFATGRALIPYVKQEIFDEMQSAIAFETPNPIEPETAATTGNNTLVIGDLVLAQDGKEPGWWEASVLEITDERVTLKWRDWPQLRRFTRTRNQIAIIGAVQPTQTTE